MDLGSVIAHILILIGMAIVFVATPFGQLCLFILAIALILAGFYLVVVLGSAVLVGAAAALVTVWITRNLLLWCLPYRMWKEWIYAFAAFWYVTPLLVVFPLAIIVRLLLTSWVTDDPLKHYLHLLVGASYLVNSYRLLLTWRPQAPQWLQFIATWIEFNADRQVREVETTLYHNLDQEWTAHFRANGQAVPPPAWRHQLPIHNRSLPTSAMETPTQPSIYRERTR